MGDPPTFILGFVNIIEDARCWEVTYGDTEVIHHSLMINEIVGSATVEKRVFGHFVFVKQEADINAIPFVTNIHGTYL